MNYNRFKNVARYNFAINRAMYMKLALSLLLAMSIPFLMFIMKSIWVIGLTRNLELAAASLVPGTNIGPWMSACFFIALPILCGYTFHNLLTKQTRIKELTLPASNGEKFLFHALVTVGGSIAVYALGFLLIDILQYFYVGLVCGFAHASWIPYGQAFDGVIEFDGESHIWLSFIAFLAWTAYLSTFVLGNALKYRHNVLWTYLFHFLLGFATLFGFGLLMPVMLELDIDLRNIDEVQALMTMKWVSTLFFLTVIIFCWWASFRLYRRAQITTLRNK